MKSRTFHHGAVQDQQHIWDGSVLLVVLGHFSQAKARQFVQYVRQERTALGKGQQPLNHVRAVLPDNIRVWLGPAPRPPA